MKMGLHQVADPMWIGILRHVRKNHRIRLLVDDYSHSIRCVYCACELVEGSPAMMDALCERMKKSGIQFEVLCQTVFSS